MSRSGSAPPQATEPSLECKDIITFPAPESVGLEVKSEDSTYVWSLCHYIVAKAYVDKARHTFSLQCLNLATRQSSCIIDYPASEVKLCDNTLCRDYFALLSSTRQFDIFGPRSTTKIATTPPFDATLMLKDYQLLPNAKGIMALDKEGQQLWWVDLSNKDKDPVWKKISLDHTCIDYAMLNDNTVGMIFEIYPEIEWEFYGDYYNAEMIKPSREVTIYQLDFKKNRLIKHEDAQISFRDSVTKIYASPAKDYFVTESGAASCSDLSVWQLHQTAQNVTTAKYLRFIPRDFTRVGCGIYPPVFSVDSVLFYNEPNGKLVLFDPKRWGQFETHLEQKTSILFAGPSLFVMWDWEGQMAQYDYLVKFELINAIKRELQGNYNIPADPADIIMGYAFSIFAPYHQYQAEFKVAAKKLMTEIRQAEDRLEKAGPLDQKAILSELQRAVLDKTALDRFLFLSREHPELSARVIHARVMREFPGTRVEIQKLLLQDAQAVLGVNRFTQKKK